MTTASSSVTWLRPEYEGREDELINLAEGAHLAGVSRSAVSNWASGHSNFPCLVLLTGIDKKRNKFVVREEFIDFARAERAKPRKPPADYKPRRRSIEIRADEVEHYTQQVVRLTELVPRHSVPSPLRGAGSAQRSSDSAKPASR
ncbi:hypothetical protein ABZW18_05435 [Streptomyces sp. NPDC004647]|uniref:hypothetical protein n=1 Tax=Streptomyces sp. NPDC004647 TaxID=3154671 RepID=UPI0033AA52BC